MFLSLCDRRGLSPRGERANDPFFNGWRGRRLGGDRRRFRFRANPDAAFRTLRGVIAASAAMKRLGAIRAAGHDKTPRFVVILCRALGGTPELFDGYRRED